MVTTSINIKSVLQTSIWTLALAFSFSVLGIGTKVRALTVPSAPFPADSVSFETQKQAVLKILDVAINSVVTLEQKIQSNTGLASEVKQELLSVLKEIETSFVSYKNEVNSSLTAEELKKIRAEYVQYIKQQSIRLKSVAKDNLVKLADGALIKAQELKAQVEDLLKILKVMCPQQKSTIATLESQLSQLDALINSLSGAIKVKDATQIKSLLEDLSTLSKQIVTSVQIIQKECAI